MSSLNIDQLTLDVKIKSGNAISNLNKLCKSLTKLNNTSGNKGLKETNKELDKTKDKSKEATTGVQALSAGLKSMVGAVAVTQLARGLGNLINLSNQYVENLNLFNVAMGDSTDSALEFAQSVQDVMGIDLSNWIRNQGVFQTLIAGFGVGAERATIMSQQLTQLGYDLSSFYNISVADSMQKLQSGVSGELEPLRRLGFDLSQTKLQLTATKLGIDDNVASLTQAEKAQLRYYAIMTQVTEAQGDLSRTLSTPANQIRILKDNFVMLGRSIGNIFIPLLNKVVPVLTAIVQECKKVADAIAALFGFQLPEIDYSGVNSAGDSVEDLEDDLDNAAGAAKKLKSYLLGFDELNVFDPSNNGGGSALTDTMESLWNFDLPTYDFLGNAKNTVAEIGEMIEKWKPLIVAAGTALLGWKLASTLLNSFDNLKALTGVDKLKFTAGITLAVSGLALSVDTGLDIGANGHTFQNTLKELVAAVMTGAGFGLVASAIGVSGGALIVPIAIGAALSIGVTEIVAYFKGSQLEYERKLQEDLNSRFGNIELTGVEVSLMVDKLTTSETTVALDVYVDEKKSADSLAAKITDIKSDIERMDFRINLGLDIDQDYYNEQMMNLVQTGLDYVSGRQSSLLAGLSMLSTTSAAYKNLSEFAVSYYDTAYQTLYDTGDKLKTVISEGFVEGEWLPDKLAEAQQLQKEISEVIAMVNEAELAASLDAISIKFSGTDLTAESFKQIAEQANAAIEQSLANNDEWLNGMLVEANLQLQYNLDQGMSKVQAQKIYDETVASLSEQYRTNVINITDASFNFELSTLRGAFENEFAESIKGINVDYAVGEMYEGVVMSLSSMQYGDYTTPFENFTSYYSSRLSEAINDNITPTAKENLKNLYNVLKPNTDEWTKLALEYVEAGKAIPENLIAGLNDAQQLAALAGVQGGYDYILGKELANDSNWLQTLKGASGLGASLSEEMRLGFAANTQVLYDEVNGIVTLITTDGNEIVLEATDTLVENLQSMVGKASITYTDLKNSFSGLRASTGAIASGMITDILKEELRLSTESKVTMDAYKALLSGDFTAVKTDATSKISSMVTNLLTSFKALDKDSVNEVNNMTNGVAQNITNLNSNLPNIMNITYQNITGAFDSAKAYVNQAFNNLTLGTKNGVAYDYGLRDNLTNAIGDMSSWARTNIVTPLEKTLSSANLSVPMPHFEWTSTRISSDSDLGKILDLFGVNSVPSLNVKWYAEGGLPDTGELFVAREAGAELVGSIGGHTAVANNDQIVEAVSLGVAEAVSSVLGGSDKGETAQINIKLDGQVIYDDMLRISKSRGTNIGQGVFSRG